MLGRDGMMLRSATTIAAAEAGPSAPGVSMIASVKPLAFDCARTAGSRAAPDETTSMSSAPRVFSQFVSEPCGSMSMTQTFSFISCAATASDDASVLLPDPPFWVTNAMIRMTSAPRLSFSSPGPFGSGSALTNPRRLTSGPLTKACEIDSFRNLSRFTAPEFEPRAGVSHQDEAIIECEADPGLKSGSALEGGNAFRLAVRGERNLLDPHFGALQEFVATFLESFAALIEPDRIVQGDGALFQLINDALKLRERLLERHLCDVRISVGHISLLMSPPRRARVTGSGLRSRLIAAAPGVVHNEPAEIVYAVP